MLGTLFDVAIIGTELSGLVAGALLVKRGYQVLVIDVESERVEVKRGAYTLKPFPGLFFGFGQGHVFDEVFLELGIPFLEKKRFTLANPGYQIAMPNLRLDIPQGIDEWTGLLSVEFPSDAAEMVNLLNKATRHASVVRSLLASDTVYPALTFRERHRVKRALGQLGGDFKNSVAETADDLFNGFDLSPVARSFIEAQYRFLAPVHPDSASLFFASMILSSLNKGIFTVDGGMQVLENLFKERISSYRGELQRTGEIESVEFARLNEIKLSGKKDPVRCKKILVGTNLEDFLSRFAPKSLKGLHREMFESPPYGKHPFTLYVGIDENVVPVGMRGNVVMLSDPTARPTMRNLAFVKISPAGSTDYAPAGKRLVGITVIVDDHDGELTAPLAHKLSTNMVERLRDLIPFLDDFTEFVAYNESFALYQAMRRSAHIPPINPDDRLGIASLPNRTPHKEVFYAGKGTLPGLGMEGEAVSGVVAAQLLTEVLRK